MIHALVIWDFPSFHWLWQGAVYCKRFSPQTGGWPSLSLALFFHLSWFLWEENLSLLEVKRVIMGKPPVHQMSDGEIERPRRPTFCSSCGCDIKSKPSKTFQEQWPQCCMKPMCCGEVVLSADWWHRYTLAASDQCHWFTDIRHRVI